MIVPAPLVLQSQAFPAISHEIVLIVELNLFPATGPHREEHIGTVVGVPVHVVVGVGSGVVVKAQTGLVGLLQGQPHVLGQDLVHLPGGDLKGGADQVVGGSPQNGPDLFVAGVAPLAVEKLIKVDVLRGFIG